MCYVMQHIDVISMSDMDMKGNQYYFHHLLPLANGGDMASKPKASSKLRLQKIAVQAYLEPEQAKELKALSARTRVPQQVYIREGLDEVLAKYRRKGS